MNDRLIPPHFTLPMKPPKLWEVVTHPHPIRKPLLAPVRPSFGQRLRIGVHEILYLLLAIEIGNLAYHYLAPWPIYRIVSFVVLLILWANFASSTVRTTSKKQAQALVETVSMRAVKARSRPSLHADTTSYLVAIRKELEEVT